MLILKIIFLKIKIYYYNIFLIKKFFKNICCIYFKTRNKVDLEEFNELNQET